MKSMMASLACIGLSAVMLAGCGTNNNTGTGNGVTTKSLNRANVINQGRDLKQNAVHQGRELKQNAVNQFNNLTGANDRNRGINRGANNTGMNNAGTTNRYNTSSNVANTNNSHILQLGNWLRIVGTDGGSGANGNTMSARGTQSSRNGNRSIGIDSFGEQSAEHVVVLSVDDPQAIQAIDRINQILSDKTSLRSHSSTLVKDLSTVLQSAQ